MAVASFSVRRCRMLDPLPNRLPMVRFALVLFVLLAPPARAQSASPEAIALVSRWAEATRAAVTRVERVDYVETIDQFVDGPFNRHRLGSVSDVNYYFDRDQPDRQLREVRIDGRPVLPMRARIAQERLRRALPGFEAVRRAMGLPLQALGTLRPTGRLIAEEIDGRAVLRIEAVPRTASGPVERATLWFTRPRTDRDVPVLIRSRVVFQRDVPRAHPILVTTDYDRIDGVPVPRLRRVEATLQQRRRIRTFTVLVSVDLAFDEIRVIRR